MAEPGTKVLVRAYSFHAEERLADAENGQVLGQVLSKTEPSLDDILAPWRVLYEPWEADDSENAPITRTLSIEASKLQKEWCSFRKTSGKNERVDTKEISPSISSAIQVIKDMDQTWQAKKWVGKRGKAKTYFHRLCKTLDAHSNMLDVIPRSNEYLSIFAGTVTTIIKASVNHEAIAEDLTQALCEISEVVAGCDIDLKLFATQDMQRTVADLYAHIFLFLNDAMCWYAKSRSKRMLDSFNEKFRDAFHDSVENIQKKAGVIQQKAAQGRAAEQRTTRILVEGMRQDLRIGLEGWEREKAEQQSRELRREERLEAQTLEWGRRGLYLDHLLQSLNVFLTEAAGVQTLQWQAARMIEANNPATDTTKEAFHRSGGTLTITRDDLLLNSAGLEDHFHRDRVRLGPLDPSSPMIDPQLVAPVSEWTKSSSSQILAIAGPRFEGYELESPMTVFAARFIEFAVRSHVPIISYFCELRRHEETVGDNTKEEQGLLQMIYALIRQMLEVILPEIRTDVQLRRDRFDQLDGTIQSWEETIDVFKDIQTLLPGTVLCVVDGMQWLDSRRVNKYVTQFVEVLRNGKLKVLFTTAGQSRYLSQCLRRTELLVLEEQSMRGRGSWMFEEAQFTL